MPSHLSGSSVEEHAAALIVEYPWITAGGFNMSNMPQLIRQTEERGLKVFLADSQFVKAAADRPPLKTIRLTSFVKATAQKYSLNQRSKNLKSRSGFLDSKQIMESLNQVTERPLNSVLTGLLQSLPAEKRQQGFQIAELQARIEHLKSEIASTDITSLRQTFQARRYGLEGEAWSQADLIHLIDLAVKASENLIEKTIASLALDSDLNFDSKDELVTKCHDLLEQVIDSKVNWKILKGEFDLWADQYFQNQPTETMVPKTELILKELPPYAGIFRSCLTQNCATGSSSLYSYSPFEREYVVERKGTAIGHVGGTMVQVNGQPYFYWHDLRGSHMTQEEYGMVLNGLLNHFSVLDAKGIVLVDDAMRGSIGWGIDPTNFLSNDRVNLSYHPEDIQFRRLIASNQLVTGTGYDDPKGNLTGRVPRAQLSEPLALEVRAEVLSINGFEVPKNVVDRKLKPEERLEILSLLKGGGQFPEGLALKERMNLQSALGALENSDREGLEGYYHRVGLAFEGLSLKLSTHFFEDNLRLFAEGHLLAADAFTTPDATMQKRSLSLLSGLYLHNIEKAAEIFAGPAREWLDHPKIQNMITRSLMEKGEGGIERVAQLYRAGAPLLDLLASQPEWVDRMLESGRQEFVYEALKIREKQGVELDKAGWVRLASLLDNELSETEEYGLYVARRLALATNLEIDPEIVEQMKRTVTDEENEEIRALTAVAAMRSIAGNEVFDPKGKIYRRAARSLLNDPRPASIPPEVWDSLVASIDRTRIEKEVREKISDSAPDCRAGFAAAGS